MRSKMRSKIGRCSRGRCPRSGVVASLVDLIVVGARTSASWVGDHRLQRWLAEPLEISDSYEWHGVKRISAPSLSQALS